MLDNHIESCRKIPEEDGSPQYTSIARRVGNVAMSYKCCRQSRIEVWGGKPSSGISCSCHKEHSEAPTVQVFGEQRARQHLAASRCTKNHRESPRSTQKHLESAESLQAPRKESIQKHRLVLTCSPTTSSSNYNIHG